METQSLKATEEVGARGATHPRVTLENIKDSIGAVFFATADMILPDAVSQDEAAYIDPLGILTICVVVLKNGFVVLGKSAPASPENYTREKGEQFAYEDAVRQIWPLMGFALRDRLHRDSADAETYMRATGQLQVIPDDIRLKAMDADAVVALAVSHGYPEAGHGRVDAETFLRVKREGGSYTAPVVEQTLPTIPGDEDLQAMTDDEIYHLARDHSLPLGEDPSRENDIASLITKRDSVVVIKNDGPPPIDSDEELEGSLDGYIKDLAVAHGLEYVDRADAIAKLKKVRDSLVNHNAANSGMPNPV